MVVVGEVGEQGGKEVNKKVQELDEGLKLEGLMMVLLGEVVMNVKLVMEMGWMMRLIIEEIVFDERSFLKIVHTFGLG